MARSSTPTQACLSYLVGPGPMGGVSISMLRVGISNQDERVHALRVRLLVLAGDRPGRALAVAEWAGLLPRRSKRELEVAVDFGRRELRLEGRSSPFAANAESGGTGAHVVRAELFDGSGSAPDVLEVGLGSAPAASRP